MSQQAQHHNENRRHMKFLVLGAGMMGGAVVFDLARSRSVDRIKVADIDRERAEAVVKKMGGSKASAVVADVRDYDRIVELMKDCDVAISAVTLYHND
ncbi:MAG: saccharopine dehydrogenase NADP-binding domain-containing protein, partial [Bacteroidota bacterium]